MAAQNAGAPDIFQGAEKVEILGKLPIIMWEYIDEGRRLVGDIDAGSASVKDGVSKMQTILGILDKAADHLGNQELKNTFAAQLSMLDDLAAEKTGRDVFKADFNASLPTLERMAGPRPDFAENGGMGKQMLEREIDKAERVKSGRSGDLIVSQDVLDGIRNFLAKEILIEGISSVLLIDNAGSLLVNVGDQVDIDVVSLAAVAAANFAATERIANLIGEQDFVLLFYKGHSDSFHFCRVSKEYIIVTIFSNSLSLGLLRLKIAEVSEILEQKLPKREV